MGHLNIQIFFESNQKVEVSRRVTVCVFQVIVFLHTVLLCKELPLKTALVVCPLNTVLNWKSEFDQWQRGLRPNRLRVGRIISLLALINKITVFYFNVF